MSDPLLPSVEKDTIFLSRIDQLREKRLRTLRSQVDISIHKGQVHFLLTEKGFLAT